MGEEAQKKDVSYTDLLTKEAYSTCIVGCTGCGKSVFALDLLEGPYKDVFEHIVILCGTVEHNKAYKARSWFKLDPGVIILNPGVIILNPGERLHEIVRVLFKRFQGSPTLYLLDDLSAAKALTKRKDMLSELAFSGRHANQSVWVLSQRYSSILKDLREQTKWVCLFHCQGRDSFNECLSENVIQREEFSNLRKALASTKHAQLIIKSDIPVGFIVLTKQLVSISIAHSSAQA